MNWQKFNGEILNSPISDVVENTIQTETRLGNKLKAYIGTDSQVKRRTIELATVIVFLREHKGGFMYVQKEKITHKLSIKERMLLEVQKTIETAFNLCPILDKYKIDLEVHADINTNPTFESNTALKDAMGYILGMGYIFRAKPDSFASTYCADRLVQ